MSPELALKTYDLSKQYKDVTAVQRLNLEVPKGSVFGFLGPNGAGKTTTIRMFLGLVKPTGGTAEIVGCDIIRDRHRLAQKISAIVETPAFYDYLTGLQNLEVFARFSNLPLGKKQLGELIEQVGLTGREKHKVKTYSLGMKQRLGIAATLLNNPEVIFLDEPTNGLDPAGTVEMRSTIAGIAQAGRTVFLSSHLLNEVEQICTEVAIVQKGEVKLHGKVQHLLAGGSTFRLKTSSPERTLGILSSHPGLSPVREDAVWIRIQAEETQIPWLIRTLQKAEIDLFQIHQERNSLESLFLELTGPAPAVPQATALNHKGEQAA
ncbi:MAG: ABC transporter ATP-binding protein [Blastocatellia bacterium]|nr:ABC transporter ATP-binding protein [Blastocatellia bacterium]